jgi:hypothetical protein
MGTLTLDIETASPFEEPTDGSNETRCYEWLSVAVAYVEDGPADPETAVLFRRGGWDDEYTADLLDRLAEWCSTRDVARTLTDNGTWVDLKHLASWAESLDRTGVRPDALDDLRRILPRHVDVARAAADRHGDALWDDQVVLPDWKVYRLEGIDNETVWYDDYDFNPDFFERLGVDDEMVEGAHVGRVLGERYVDGVVAGFEETRPTANWSVSAPTTVSATSSTRPPLPVTRRRSARRPLRLPARRRRAVSASRVQRPDPARLTARPARSRWERSDRVSRGLSGIASRTVPAPPRTRPRTGSEQPPPGSPAASVPTS